MAKRITDSQVLGELGETAIKKLVLEMRFIYDPRGRLEAGVDGIIELRDPKSGAPLGKLLGAQVKATESGQYIRETDRSFEYLLKPDDLKYWRGSNIPVIIVVWRQSDGSAYWKDVTDCVKGEERRLKFDKVADVFDTLCADSIGALTIDRHTPGVYLPPLNQGEEAIHQPPAYQASRRNLSGLVAFRERTRRHTRTDEARQHPIRLGHPQAAICFVLRSKRLRHACDRRP